MHPFLFQVGKYPFPPTYGVVALIAIIACWFLIKRYAALEGRPEVTTAEGFMLIALVGIVAARVFEAALSWRKIADDPRELLVILFMSGGVFLGGVFGSIAFAGYWLRRIKMPYLQGLDILALVATLSMAIARWGCFFSGCCWGRPTGVPWAITFPPLARRVHEGLPAEPIHPTQIYLSLFSAALFGFLVWLYRRKRFHGQIGLTYLVLYPIGRFAIEYYRGDAERGFVLGGALSTSQAICIPLFAIAAVLLFVTWRRHERSGAPDWRPAARPAGGAPLTRRERRREVRSGTR